MYNRSDSARSYDRRPSGNRSQGRGNSTHSSYGSARPGRTFNRRPQRRGMPATTIRQDQYIAKAVETTPETSYVSKHQFNDFDFESILKANIIKKSYFFPTRIQDETMPHILMGRDVLGLAVTGSGKTAAFLIPLINKVLRNPTQKVLIIVPTRELAMQINEEFTQFALKTNLKSVVVIGGANMNPQMYLLRKNPHFVIGTPGRLKDLSNRGALRLNVFNNIVLDEVDRMLDMGFINDIRFLIDKLPQKRQTLFFSATMSKEANEVAKTLLIDPVKVEVESQKTAKNIEQDIVKVLPGANKAEILHDLLIQEEFEKVLIFSRTKRGADRLSFELISRGFKVEALHGDKTQYKRDKVIMRFRENSIRILVATDVAARGIDIPDITHVINYDEPATYEDYIHRIGRTGRVGKKGKALTFVEDRGQSGDYKPRTVFASHARSFKKRH